MVWYVYYKRCSPSQLEEAESRTNASCVGRKIASLRIQTIPLYLPCLSSLLSANHPERLFARNHSGRSSASNDFHRSSEHSLVRSRNRSCPNSAPPDFFYSGRHQRRSTRQTMSLLFSMTRRTLGRCPSRTTRNPASGTLSSSSCRRRGRQCLRAVCPRLARSILTFFSDIWCFIRP